MPLDRDAAREAVRRTIGTPIADAHIDVMLDALEGCVRPDPLQVDVEYEWTAQQWRDWSLKLSGMLPDEWDGDEDELSIIEDYVRYFSKQSRWPHPEWFRRPVQEGVVLTREDANRAWDWAMRPDEEPDGLSPEDDALAQRLRSAS